FFGKQTVLGCGYQMGPAKFKTTMEKFRRKIEPEFAEQVIQAYRNENQNIQRFWWGINAKALEAMKGNDNGWFSRCRVRCVRYLRCHLPSGRYLFYPTPRLGTDPKFGTERVEYFGQNTYTREWGMVGTYGGKITENIVQALSRDVLAESMFRLQDLGAR